MTGPRYRIVAIFSLMFILSLYAGVVQGAYPYAPPASYAVADARAVSAPFTSSTSIGPLAEYLCNWTNNPYERARAIYTWVASNISYDVAALKSGKYPPMDVVSVLKRRSAVCQGYAETFYGLARKGGLEAYVIPGWSKDLGNGGGVAGEPNHAWSAFKAGGRWHLVDCTWGAGYLDGTGFVRSFTDAYFDTPPESMAYSHFPREPRWQILDRPVSKVDFNRRVVVSRPFLTYRVGGLSHSQAQLNTDGRLALSMNVPAACKVLPTLYLEGRALGVEYGLGQNVRGRATVNLELPYKGVYTLAISLAEPGSNQYSTALQYQVLCTRGLGEGCGFPTLMSDYRDRGASLKEPWSRRLVQGRKYRFNIDIPGAVAAAVITVDASGKQAWNKMTLAGSGYSGSFVPKAGQAHIVAQFPGDDRWKGLVEYQVM